MKTKLIATILLLVMIAILFASEDATEQEEYFRKKQELDLLAERFKAETGFEGTIQYNYIRMTLSQFRGNFRDISFTADQDTILFRIAVNSILGRVIPYIAATRDQLLPSPIRTSVLGVEAAYKQRMYGYSSERQGGVEVFYNKDKHLFEVNDSSEPIIVQPPVINYTEEDSHRIVLAEHKKKYNNTKKDIVVHTGSRLVYSNKGGQGYRLVYIVTLSDYINAYYVDVETGSIIFVKPVSTIDYNGNVRVLGYTYPSFTEGYVNIPSNHTGEKPVEDIEVKINSVLGQTNADGYRYFNDDQISNYLITYQSSNFKITHSSNENLCLTSNNYTPLGDNTYSSILGDENYFASNIHNHALHYYNSLQSYDSDFNTMVHFIADFNFNDPNVFGRFVPDGTKIQLFDGRYSRTIQHELSHCFVYFELENQLFCDGLYFGNDKAMDEAFANYLPCAISLNPKIPSYTGSIDLDLEDFVIPASNTLNESTYADYPYGLVIADAWWSLRSHFQSYVWDQILVRNLRVIETYNFLDLRKPRYFYNQLMRDQADDTINWELNANQKAVKDAYNSRGLHFYPKVESISEANSSRNIFGLNEPVHVKISDCPQNTKINIYVIKHGTYTYTDGALVTGLSNFYASGFTPITNVTTDPSGEWSGYIWTTPISAEEGVGDYDIIVDIGSPTTPDGIIHYAFSAANVMDGFDGRTKPGFKVTDQNIDLVIAMDLSTSIQENVLEQVVKTGQIIVSQLINGDRVNVYGYGHKYFPNWTPNEILRNIIPVNSTSLMTIYNNHNTLINQTWIPADLDALCTNMVSPITNSHARFIASERPKAMILISDGWHYIVEDDNTYPVNPVNAIHSLIDTYFLPDSIACYTMCYSIPYPTNNESLYIPYDHITAGHLMSNIALWGEGESYYQNSAFSSFLDIDEMLNEIRNTNSTEYYKGIFSQNPYIELSFPVEINANALQLNLAIDQYTASDPLIFSLISPSGVEYSNASNSYNFYKSSARLDIPNPEEGIWIAAVERLPNITSVDTLYISAKVDSDIRVDCLKPPTIHEIDRPFPVRVAAWDFLTPIVGAQVSIKVSRENWSCTEALYDDGNHNDGEANDGVYGNNLYFYNDALQAFSNVSGIYELRYETNIPTLSARKIKTYKISMTAPADFPYSTTGRRLNQGWNWVGFPRLASENGGNLIDYATISLEPHLTTVLSEYGYASYDDYWQYYGLQYLDSKEGYKLRIRDVSSIQLYEMGTLVDTTSVYRINEGWNWITYPCYATVYPEDALAEIWNDIDYIKAQTWSMKKEHGVWVHDNFSLRPIIRYGDSIDVHAIQDASLIWNGRVPREDTKPLQAQFYTFEDNPDYETLMVEGIDGNPTYEEIGVFQDEVCIGARVFEGYPIQILAYSEPVQSDSTMLEFRIWDGSKGETKLVAKGSFGDRAASEAAKLLPELGAFRHVVLQKEGIVVPPVFSLRGNFPNPFNPSTTIQFSLPVSGNVNLCIYNLKGQKVAELLNSDLNAGNHQIIWTGKDKNGRSVASGIYFAKLEQAKLSKTHKMVLLK